MPEKQLFFSVCIFMSTFLGLTMLLVVKIFTDNFIRNRKRNITESCMKLISYKSPVCWICASTAVFNFSIMTDGYPDLASSCTFVPPLLNNQHHFCTFASFITPSRYTSTSCQISAGLILHLKNESLITLQSCRIDN